MWTPLPTMLLDLRRPSVFMWAVACPQERKAANPPNAATEAGDQLRRGRLDSIHSESSTTASSVLDQLAASLRLA